MNKPTLYRQRVIPKECIHLKDDVVLFRSRDYILTSWNTIRPKKDLHHGLSCYFLKEGYKVSKFYTREHTLIRWYCDIVQHTYDADSDTYIFKDLLADVIVYPDSSIKVDDLDELADAFEEGLISKAELTASLRAANRLLRQIYEGEFETIQDEINRLEDTYLPWG